MQAGGQLLAPFLRRYRLCFLTQGESLGSGFVGWSCLCMLGSEITSQHDQAWLPYVLGTKLRSSRWHWGAFLGQLPSPGELSVMLLMDSLAVLKRICTKKGSQTGESWCWCDTQPHLQSLCMSIASSLIGDNNITSLQAGVRIWWENRWLAFSMLPIHTTHATGNVDVCKSVFLVILNTGMQILERWESTISRWTQNFLSELFPCLSKLSKTTPTAQTLQGL